MHFHFYTLSPLLFSITNAAKSPQELIKDLNNRYKYGKPSNDASETGVAWRSFDSFADVTHDGLPTKHYKITEDVQTAKKMFGGTAAHPENLPASIINNDLSSSNEYGINLFRSWGLPVHPYQNSTMVRVLFGPPAGIVYSPCAVDKALKCSYVQSADTDDRVNAGCGRLDVAGLNYSNYFDLDACSKDDLLYLSSAANTVNHEVITLQVDTNNTSKDLTGDGAEIELLFNRLLNPRLTVNFGNDTIKSEFYDRLKSSDLEDQYHNLAEFRNLTSSCRAVFDKMKKFPDLPPFFESPGYYGSLDASTRTQPKQQLKDMLQWQSLLGTASWNQNTGSTPWNPAEIDQLYNELALDVDAVDQLEDDDECQAIEALVKVCGEHDPFYVDNADGSSRCIDYEHLFKLAFPKIDVPPIIWLDLNNTDEPFSMSCDKVVSTCGEDKRTNFLRGKGKATAIA